MRYGTAKYSTFKYGTYPLNDNLLWAIEVDWDGDGLWSGENEASRVFGMSSSRGRDFLVTPNGVGFEPMSVGKLSFKVDNSDGRYDPYSISGPLYGKLSPGKKVRVMVKNTSTGTLYPVFVGRLENIIPYGRRGISELVVVDGWDKLSQADVVARVELGLNVDQLLYKILSKAGWEDEFGFDLDVSSDNLPFRWEKKNKAKAKLEDLSNSTLGTVFIAADGIFKYYSRHHPTLPKVTITEEELLKDIAIPQPWENIRNQITVRAYPQTLQSLSILWSLGDPIWLDGGQTITMELPYSYNNNEVPALLLLFQPHEDYEFTDILNPGPLSTPKVSISDLGYELVDNGTSVWIKLTNYSTYGGYVSKLQFRGLPITCLYPMSSLVDVGDYAINPRSFLLDSNWIQDKYFADTIAGFLGDYLFTKMKFPTVIVEARPGLQFYLDLFDVVTLDLGTWGINEKFQVIKIEHEWLKENGQLVRTKFTFEPVKEVGLPYWVMGTSALGSTTKIGW